MKKIILFTLLAVLTTACLEYKEKTKINEDGSGEIKFAIGISESFFNMSNGATDMKEFDEARIKQKYSKAKGVKFVGSKTYSEAGNRWIEINLNFDSVEDLMEASKDTSNLGMIGDIKLSEESNGNMTFERKISSSKNNSENDSTNNGKGEDIAGAMFSNYKWTYELTLPGKILNTNAATNDVDEKTNTVKWYFTLGSLAKASSMHVTYAKPSSVNLTMLILLVLGAIVLAIVLLYLLKLKKDDKVRVN